MKNNKGFTLIELIAVMMIIGTIMLLAVPNVIGMVDRNKRMGYITDAKKMVKLATYKFNSEKLRPGGSSCISYKLSDLDRSDLSNPPLGGTYDLNLSYVNITYSANEYVYYVQLLESYQDGGTTYYRGVRKTNSNNLMKDNAKMKYVTLRQNDKSGFTNSCTGIN